jgi:ribonuclease P protein component
MVRHVLPLQASAAIDRVLRTPATRRSAHFSLHIASEQDSLAGAASSPDRLSTGWEVNQPRSVDNVNGTARVACVVPKRHARRAVTRNLIKRQVRAIARGCAALLAPGDYVMRLARPFAVADFPSAASLPLKDAVRGELRMLFDATQPAKAARGAHRPAGRPGAGSRPRASG